MVYQWRLCNSVNEKRLSMGLGVDDFEDMPRKAIEAKLDQITGSHMRWDPSANLARLYCRLHFLGMLNAHFERVNERLIQESNPNGTV